MDKKVTLEIFLKCDTKRPPVQISLVTGGLPYEQNN